jgi:hypothetical protein
VRPSLGENAQEALSRLEDAFTSAGTPISVMGTNPEVPQQEDEEQDWDDLTVVDETGPGVEIKGTIYGRGSMDTGWRLVIDYAASPAVACVLSAYVGAFGAGAFTRLIMVFLTCVL